MRILHERDTEELLAYVRKEPEMNLFWIGDIENYGLEGGMVTVYLHEERDRWDFLVLRFHQNCLLYSQYADFNAEEAVRSLRGQGPELISGKTELLDKIAPAFPQWTIDATYMSRCDHAQDIQVLPDALTIRRLGKEDAAKMIGLLSDIEEFAKTYKKEKRQERIEEMIGEMEKGSKTAMGGFIDGELVSVASTSAENSESAMIVGVATALGYRGRGYASAVISALCQDQFARGKKYLCLFYSNPVAGRIYNRIGFQELGTYGILS